MPTDSESEGTEDRRPLPPACFGLKEPASNTGDIPGPGSGRQQKAGLGPRVWTGHCHCDWQVRTVTEVTAAVTEVYYSAEVWDHGSHKAASSSAATSDSDSEVTSLEPTYARRIFRDDHSDVLQAADL